jgi:hypothetical protein
MRGSVLSNIRPLVITVLILIVSEVLSSTLLPLMGLDNYRLPFHIIIVLYFGFKLESAYTAIFIFIIQYFHSFFSIEGWEIGTISGIFICILVSYLKNLIHFKSNFMTIFITQMFQFIWFLVISILLYIKYSNTEYIIAKFWRFLPESILLSLVAPFFFVIFDTIWSYQRDSSLGERA